MASKSEDVDDIYPDVGLDVPEYDNTLSASARMGSPANRASAARPTSSGYSRVSAPETGPGSIARYTDNVFNRQSSYVNALGARSTVMVNNARESLQTVENVRDFIPDRGFTFKLQGGHTGGVFATFIHAPGNGTSPPLIITGSDDKTAIIWNLHTGERVRRLEGGHTKTITSIGVYTPVNLSSPSLVVTASKDSTAVVWELNSGKVVHKLKGGHGVHEISSVVVYSPAIASVPPLIVTGGWDHHGVVWDLITGQQMYRLEEGHKRGITSMALYIPLDGTPPMVITGGADELCVVWNLTNGQVVRKLEGAHTDRVFSVTVHAPEGGTCPVLVITGGEDRIAVVWDLQSGSVLSKLEGGHSGTISGIAVYSPPDGVSSPLVLTAGEDKVAVVWDLVTGTQVRRLTGCHTASLHAAAVYAPRGGRGSPLFITGAQDRTAVIWDLWSSEQVRRLEGGHTKPIKAVAVYIPPDNTIPAVIITGSYDKTAIVWDLQTQQIMHTLENGHTGEITSVVVYTPPSPKASPLVITGSEDKTAVVWDVFTGEQLHKLMGGHTDWITCLAVFESADRMSSPLIISGGYDKLAIVWDLGTGKLIRKLAGEHTAALTSVAVFVPAVDSYATPLIVTGSEDKTVIIWDLESGQVVRKLAAHTAGVTALLVHAPTDLTVQVVSVSSDKSAIVWDLHSGKIVRKMDNFHKESISSVTMYNTGDPTSPPLVITASQDKTMVVWELATGKVVRILDGVHSKAISSVAVYEPKDHHSPPLVITGSHDGTAAVWKNALLTFEFMPLMDEIQRLFQADVETFHTGPEPWSRINAIISRYGEGFWYENHGLFLAALVDVKDCATRDSFFNTFASVLTRVVHLIPLTMQGKQAKCVLQMAVERKLRIRHLIFDAWLSVLNSHDADFLWQVFHPSMTLRRSALLALSDIYPAEFVDFICKLRLVRSHPLLSRGCPSYYINNFSGMVIEGMPTAITVDMWTKVAGYHSDINDTNAQPITAYMVPLAAAADMKLLQAYVDVSDSLDDLAIFNSDIGSVAFRYAWRSFGKDAHINAMMYYGLFVAVYTCSVVVFDRLHQSDHAYGPVLAWILQAYVLRLVVKYIIDEVRQCYNDYSIRLRRNNERMQSVARVVVTDEPVGEKLVPGQHRQAFLRTSKRFRFLRKACSRAADYIRTLTVVKVFKIVYRHFSDFWNILDLSVILIVLLGTLLRCFYGKETDRSRDVLAIGCVLVWFKLLYFMRPFKGSGPLVTMILKIMSDIKYFLFILAVVLTGFALAFWMISYPDSDLPFGTIPSSFINTFLYMLGQNISADFGHTSSPNLGVFLLVLFMLFMMILMLNLLIALMGNTFKVVQSKGLAQWRLEQASMMLEQRFTLKADVLRRHRHFCRIHVLKTTALVEKAKKETLRDGERAIRRETMVGQALAHSALKGSTMDAKLQALTSATQEALERKLQASQDATAAQLLTLAARQTAVDAKIDSLENKLDSILAKLTVKDKEGAKFGTLLNPFNNTAAAAAASVAKEST